MNEDEQRLLNDVLAGLPHNAHIVEWGSGGSTKFIAKRLKHEQRLYTIEHNHEWYDKVASRVSQFNVEQIYARPTLPLSVYGYATEMEENPAGLTEYLWPNVDWSKVHLVLVDGIARGACMALSAIRCVSGTQVLLHDYTGREYRYEWAVSLLEMQQLAHTLLLMCVR